MCQPAENQYGKKSGGKETGRRESCVREKKQSVNTNTFSGVLVSLKKIYYYLMRLLFIL